MNTSVNASNFMSIFNVLQERKHGVHAVLGRARGEPDRGTPAAAVGGQAGDLPHCLDTDPQHAEHARGVDPVPSFPLFWSPESPVRGDPELPAPD